MVSAHIHDGIHSSVVMIVLVKLLFYSDFVLLLPYVTDNWVGANTKEVNLMIVFVCLGWHR